MPTEHMHVCAGGRASAVSPSLWIPERAELRAGRSGIHWEPFPHCSSLKARAASGAWESGLEQDGCGMGHGTLLEPYYCKNILLSGMYSRDLHRVTDQSSV